jgi:hypothetical protein
MSTVDTQQRHSQRAARTGDGEPGSLAPNHIIASWLRRKAQSQQTVVVTALMALRIAAELEKVEFDKARVLGR